ncbi:hypothetical protein, partial [Enterocloster clostridioformis]|uniref:hypothetical protein n=1 Tax=Enterocloster clostridioformis TaxID=1531 RepID=UPI003D28D436
SLSNKMDNSLLAVRDINHKYIVVERSTIFMNIRNEIKAYIVREGFTMSELVEKLTEQYGWSPSVPNLSDKLRRESLRYKEAVELADALGYDLVWQKRR